LDLSCSPASLLPLFSSPQLLRGRLPGDSEPLYISPPFDLLPLGQTRPRRFNRRPGPFPSLFRLPRVFFPCFSKILQGHTLLPPAGSLVIPFGVPISFASPFEVLDLSRPFEEVNFPCRPPVPSFFESVLSLALQPLLFGCHEKLENPPPVLLPRTGGPPLQSFLWSFVLWVPHQKQIFCTRSPPSFFFFTEPPMFFSSLNRYRLSFPG